MAAPLPHCRLDAYGRTSGGPAGALLGALCTLATHMRHGTGGVALVRTGWLAGIP